MNYLPKNYYNNDQNLGSWIPYHSEGNYEYREDYLTYGGGNYMQSSPNDVLNASLDVTPPWDATLWDHPLDPDVCRTLAGLTRPQLHLCRK